MLVCNHCGYAYYRTSTRTSKRKIYYYRCLGSDNYRHLNGPLCSNRPIRQDELDQTVWHQIIHLLETPGLIQAEIERRLDEIRHANPTQRRKASLNKELARVQSRTEKLLDAYQEGILMLSELRRRLPELRKQAETLELQIGSLEMAEVEQQAFLRVAGNIEGFLARLRASADTLDITDRQKILRLVVKEILVDEKPLRYDILFQ